MADEHVRSDHYVDVDGRGSGGEMLARCIHRHLVDACPQCRDEWEKLGSLLQKTFLESLRGFTSSEPRAPADDELPVDAATLAAQDAYVEDLRHLRRRAFEQLWSLRRLPAGQRAGKVRGAYRQYRGRAFAELLIEESRSHVRTAPLEALEWIDLVPLALEWARGEGGPAWTPDLLARAAAHRANALRIQGDHPAAERIFIDLRRSLAANPVGDTRVLAEIASLEASLRIDQNLPAQAEELLDRSALAYQYAGDSRGVAKARVQQVVLMRTQGRNEEILSLLEEASGHLTPSAEAGDLLMLTLITERVNALCELERFAEANRLLQHHADDFEASEDPHTGAVFRCLDGRIALGRKLYAEAEETFVSCRDAMLTLGRNHDAAIASLYLAEVLLELGRTADLRRLAADLVEWFRSSRLPAETLKAIQVFSRAVAGGRLTPDLLHELRLATIDMTTPPFQS